jgi:hypothetical protein
MSTDWRTNCSAWRSRASLLVALQVSSEDVVSAVNRDRFAEIKTSHEVRSHGIVQILFLFPVALECFQVYPETFDTILGLVFAPVIMSHLVTSKDTMKTLHLMNALDLFLEAAPELLRLNHVQIMNTTKIAKRKVVYNFYSIHIWRYSKPFC